MARKFVGAWMVGPKGVPGVSVKVYNEGGMRGPYVVVVGGEALPGTFSRPTAARAAGVKAAIARATDPARVFWP